MYRISRILYKPRNVNIFTKNSILRQIQNTTEITTLGQNEEINVTGNITEHDNSFEVINVANIKPEDFPISFTGDGFNYREAREWRMDFMTILKQKKVDDDECILPLKLGLMEKDRLTKMFESKYPGLYNIIKKIKEEPKSLKIGQSKQLFFPFRLKNNLMAQNEEQEIVLNKKVEDRMEAFKMMGDRLMNFLKSKTDPKDLELQQEIDYFRDNICKANYSNPDPFVPKSDTPCGGCGAHLHCQDYALPGYMPKDKFILLNEEELKGEFCQRCLYLKTLNVALKLNVDVKDYPKLLSHIKYQKALVILMVDLLDFPSSIYPGLVDIIGEDKPIFVVGNKVDLLPNDNYLFHTKYLDRIKMSISNYLKDYGIDRGRNIKSISLISAKTGFGVEELITKLQQLWYKKGHVYLIGSVNAGKSSLFNAFLQSDYCKSDVCDMIQRATVSPWPGTTLNLLKFPIMQPTQFEVKLRATRLFNVYRQMYIENYLRKSLYFQTRNPKYQTLIGRIEMTYRKDFRNYEDEDKAKLEPVERKEMKVTKYLDLARPDRRHFFCHDTPGTVFQDQIIDLLTTDEVQKAIPTDTIATRNFILKEGQSLFMGGLARVDLLNVDNRNPYKAKMIRVTVFCSKHLPVNIVPIDQAELFYSIYVQAGMLVVPNNDPQRLADFPPFYGKEFETKGVSFTESCSDIVFSSAGWIALTPLQDTFIRLRAYTPEGRGLSIRTPSLLKFAVRTSTTKPKLVQPPKFELDKLLEYSHFKKNGNKRLARGIKQ